MTNKARSEQVAKVMERVCDLCVHPFQEADQDKLYERCDSCQVTAALWDTLKDAGLTFDTMVSGIAKLMK